MAVQAVLHQRASLTTEIFLSAVCRPEFSAPIASPVAHPALSTGGVGIFRSCPPKYVCLLASEVHAIKTLPQSVGVAPPEAIMPNIGDKHPLGLPHLRQTLFESFIFPLLTPKD